MASSYHRLLERQLHRAFGGEPSGIPGLEAFLRRVSDAYVQYDVERAMLGRSLELSSGELFQANAELRGVFHALPDNVFLLDGELRIVDVKSCPPDDGNLVSTAWIGRALAETAFVRADAGVLEAVEVVRTSGGMTSVEVVVRDGRGFEAYELRLLPLSSERMLALARNITDRRRAEDAMSRAIEAAEDHARAKSEFLATMSHELRTPLNGVIGMASLLVETDLSKEQRELAEVIQSSGELLLTLINDVLDFSKIEAGRLELELVRFDPRVVVEETLDLLAARAFDKGIELVGRIAPAVPPTLIGDPGRLRQVLGNLVGNAVKFTAEGEVEVRVDVAASSSKDVLLGFEIEDTGMGIDPAAQTRIFEPFVQADSSITRKHGGTGLGLAICRQLVTLMGGSIGVESAPGRGSTFRFTASFAADGGGGAVIDAAAGALKDLRVLCVDDNAKSLDALGAILAGWGMVPVAARDAKEALELVESESVGAAPVELAIVDLRMPGQCGLELAAALRGKERQRALPIILMVPFDHASALDPAASSMVDAVVRKPIRPSSLLDRIMTVAPAGAGRRRASPASAPAAAPAVFPEVRGLSVLVVEDNPVNQLVAQRILERLDCRVELAGNGLEALTMLARATYDVVLMDCQMPVLDGYRATAEIRAREGPARDAIIIAMTADVSEDARSRCLSSGMDGFVSKPVKPAELAAALARFARVIARRQADVPLPAR